MELHTDKAFNCTADHEKKHEMMLDLSLSAHKSDNLFAGSDQTPTPTRLIRNCEEVGLFEDLRHVNPFEETFRRAVEQKTGQTPTHLPNSVDAHVDEDSLHTPQVFPQLETGTDAGAFSCEMGAKPLDSPPSAAVALDVPAVEELLRDAAADAFKLATSRQNSDNSTVSSTGYGKFYKYRSIAEKPAAATPAPTTQLPVVISEHGAAADSTAAASLPFVQLPTFQLLQPQLITITFPPGATNSNGSKPNGGTVNAIPIQTVKPFIMPKLAPTSTSLDATVATNNHSLVTNGAPTRQQLLSAPTAAPAAVTVTPTVTYSQQQQQLPPHEPSSASLTPTSQLPIKERLKAILSSSNKSQRIVEAVPPKKCNRRGCGKYDDDCILRRRAAAMRYRNKMRNEHKDLRQRNGVLEAENEKLRARVKQLEQDLVKQQQTLLENEAGGLLTMPAQIQIPPSTLHMVMNIPTMVVPVAGQPTLMQPITYRLEKK